MEMHRNSRCWCGSGKKYKQCHEKFDEKIREFARNGEIVPDRSLIKSTKDILGIKKSAAINTGVLDHVAKHIHVGMSTGDIDRLVYDYTVSHGAIPAPLNYEGFPKSVCTSVKECLEIGIKAVKPWGHVGDIGAAIHEYATSKGYSVVIDFAGHGVGKAFHEDPIVSHVGRKGKGMILAPGMVFTIEPMINEGDYHLYIDEDNGWTSYTADGKLSAQWEHTLLVTEKGVEILTY